MNRLWQVTALASVRLGGTRLFLSGGEETLIRVHQVQIFCADIRWVGTYFRYNALRPFACPSISSTTKTFSSPDDKQEQFERGGSSARSPLKYPLSDRLTTLRWLSQEENLNAKQSDKEK